MNWIFWSLLSAFFAGLTAILAKLGVNEMNSNLATAIRTAVVLVMSWAIVFATNSNILRAKISNRAWVFLVLSGIATGLSWLCYFRALKMGEASRVAPIDKLSVVFAVVLSAVVLHEKLGWHQTVGVGLMVAGALMVAWK
jgi:transporter family protein